MTEPTPTFVLTTTPVTTADFGTSPGTTSEFTTTPGQGFTTPGQGFTTTPSIVVDTSSLLPPVQSVVLNEKQKMTIAGMHALLFFILNHPIMYKYVNKIVNLIMGKNADLISNFYGCPTPTGVVVHAVVFFLLSRAILQLPLWKLNEQQNEKSIVLDESQKWAISGTSALVFIIIGMPWTFQLVDKLFLGKSLIFENGCPTLIGLAAHTVVFLGLDRATLELVNVPPQPSS